MKQVLAQRNALVTVVAVSALGAFTIVGAQQRQGQSSEPAAQVPPPAQRGPRPAPTFQPLLDPQGRVRDESFLPSPALSAPDRIYADIDGRRMKDILNDVVAISRRSRDDGNKYWGRVSGTKYEAMTGDLIEAKQPGHGASCP